MIINIKDTLVLDDNLEYVVVSKANYEGIIYYYMLEKNNNIDSLFCYLENEELVEVTDENLIKKLLPLFLDVSFKEITEIVS